MAGGSFAVFDPVGSNDTEPASINASGTIAGSYRDANNIIHGFVRNADGTITEFDAPGPNFETVPFDINDGGFIAGSYRESKQRGFGFLRAPDGTIKLFRCAKITVAYGVNATGSITGTCSDKGSPVQGFVRGSRGKITKFQIDNIGTSPIGINDAGAIVGYYGDVGDILVHGFVLPNGANGGWATFDPEGAQQTYPMSINDRGTIAGYYIGPSDSPYRGFVRTNVGKITTFQPTKDATQTIASSINATGSITGYYYSGGSYHGFLRMP